jgi:hydrogenase nickel incorporation protein HypA/HybF
VKPPQPADEPGCPGEPTKPAAHVASAARGFSGISETRELAIACDIAERVAKAAGGRKVHRITLEIGKLSGVIPDAIAFCFPEVARGTPAETARLDIRQIDGRAYCESCETEFPIVDMSGLCPCGSIRFRPIAGEELNLKSIELEIAP